MKLRKLMMMFHLCLGGMFLTGCNSASTDDGSGVNGSYQLVYLEANPPAGGPYAEGDTAVMTLNGNTFMLFVAGQQPVVLNNPVATGEFEVSWSNGTLVYAVSEVNGELNEVNVGIDNGAGNAPTFLGQFKEP